MNNSKVVAELILKLNAEIYKLRLEIGGLWTDNRSLIQRLAQAARLQDEADAWANCCDERDALKAELTEARSYIGFIDAESEYFKKERYLLQSRLAQATAIIDYLWLHTELDAIAKSDIDKFYVGSTDAEKAARAEMVRVANEPAEGGFVMSERDQFMATIKEMWINIGRSEKTWDAVHDWEELFRLSGRKADAAPWAFNEALRCE